MGLNRLCLRWCQEERKKTVVKGCNYAKMGHRAVSLRLWCCFRFQRKHIFPHISIYKTFLKRSRRRENLLQYGWNALPKARSSYIISYFRCIKWAFIFGSKVTFDRQMTCRWQKHVSARMVKAAQRGIPFVNMDLQCRDTGGSEYHTSFSTNFALFPLGPGRLCAHCARAQLF